MNAQTVGGKATWFERHRETFFWVSMAAVMVIIPAMPAYAGVDTTMLGGRLLLFLRDWIILPLGLMSIVAAGLAAVFKPEAAKTAIWITLVCAGLFFIINNADKIQQAVK